jgi:hypothetical protein
LLAGKELQWASWRVLAGKHRLISTTLESLAGKGVSVGEMPDRLAGKGVSVRTHLDVLAGKQLWMTSTGSCLPVRNSEWGAS